MGEVVDLASFRASPAAPFGRWPPRIRLRREPGWRLAEGAVKVDRSTRWGNPFRVGRPVDMAAAERWGWLIENPAFVCESAEQAVNRFAWKLSADPEGQAAVRAALAGRAVACWCGLKAVCHADILREVANP